MPLRVTWTLFALIVVATAAVYAPLRHADFVNLDDPQYARDNAHVHQGFTAESLAWAFSVDRVPSGYHPLTQLTYMFDAQLFGARNAGAHHMMNLAWHLGATVMMMLFLLRLTNMPGRSLFLTAAFALHPAHVESVAWIAERKDVVSVFFGLLTLYVYVGYARQPSAKRYTLVIVCFILALLGKPMMVTLPVLMLLLDAWPLKRATSPLSKRGRSSFWEKLPLFALAGVSAVLTVITQKHMGAVADATFPLSLRLALATVAVGYAYPLMTFFPHDLAVYYPPHMPPTWRIVLAACIIAFVGAAALMQWRKRPYLLVGLLWYVVVLLPVLGILRAGGQAMADRYTYLSMTGLLIMVVWLICEWTPPRRTLAAAGVAAVIAMTLMTARQVTHWQNSVTLFRHTVAVTDRNVMALNRLAAAYTAREQWQPAYDTYAALLRLKPRGAMGLLGFGRAAEGLGRYGDAADAYQILIEDDPDHLQANYRVGLLLARHGALEPAAERLRIVTRTRPDFADAHNALGEVLMYLKQRDAAIASFQAALEAESNHTAARANLQRAQREALP